MSDRGVIEAAGGIVVVAGDKVEAAMMRTSLLCIQCKDRSLEHVHDSWIFRYVLTMSIIFQNLCLVPCMCY
jgi:hypothetical protein